jgi:hypothetical protein
MPHKVVARLLALGNAIANHPNRLLLLRPAFGESGPLFDHWV